MIQKVRFANHTYKHVQVRRHIRYAVELQKGG